MKRAVFSGYKKMSDTTRRRLAIGLLALYFALPLLGEIIGAVRLDEEDTVYDLTVSPHPNFFANGILIHNKLRKK